jgi:hypothetical protein
MQLHGTLVSKKSSAVGSTSARRHTHQIPQPIAAARFERLIRSCLILAGLTGAVAWGDASAAEMPNRFRGVWGNCDAPKNESDVGEFPFFIVAARGYEEHETSCALISSSRIRGGDRESLTFSCGVEGEQETRKEVWSITQKKTEIWSFIISQPFLLISTGPHGGM